MHLALKKGVQLVQVRAAVAAWGAAWGAGGGGDQRCTATPSVLCSTLPLL